MCVPHHTDCGELSRDFRLCTHQIKKVDKCFLSEQTKEQEKELMFIKLAKNFSLNYLFPYSELNQHEKIRLKS